MPLSSASQSALCTLGNGLAKELTTVVTTLDQISDVVTDLPNLTDGTATLVVGEVTSLILLPPGYYIASATTSASFLECTDANTWQFTGSGAPVKVQTPIGANGLVLQQSGARLAAFGGTPIVKPTVSGAKGSNAALASLMTALGPSGLNLVADSTTA